MKPYPRYRSQSLWRYTPRAAIRKPLPQQQAATTPPLRGPARSSHRPAIAADSPSQTIASVKIHWSSVNVQSPGPDCVMPTARLSGILNTLNAYAWPMQRWIASAAGGTSQRLNPGGAMIRSRDRSPAMRSLGRENGYSLQEAPGYMNLRATARKEPYLIASAFAATSVVVGVVWDISWHRSIGRDTFWTPDHLAIYLGGALAGASCGWLVLRTTFAPAQGGQ